MVSFKCVLGLGVLVLATAQPVDQPPVLKEAPQVAYYRESKPLALECVTEKPGQQVQYSWQKDGKPFDWKTIPNIAQRQNEGTLVFLKPQSENEGDYQCFAQSDAGTASTRVISLKKAYLNIPNVTPVKHTPVEGKTYKLDCPMPDAVPKPIVYWEQRHHLDNGITLSVQDQRITQGRDNSLYFSSVDKSDVSKRFKYVCLARNAALDEFVPIAEHFIEALKENKEPKTGEMVAQYLDNDVTAKAGENIFLYCIYGGVPLAHPDWFKDGKNVNNGPDDRVTRHNKSAGKRLLIRNVLPEDQGRYTCVVDNEVGKPQNHSMQLNVIGVPRLANKLPTQLVVKQGQDLTIPCQIIGNPAPSASWTYNAKTLSGNDRTTIEKTDSNAWKSNANLIIKNVQKSDKGYYGCKGVNKYGDVYSETAVVVN